MQVHQLRQSICCCNPPGTELLKSPLLSTSRAKYLFEQQIMALSFVVYIFCALKDRNNFGWYPCNRD